VSEGVSPIRTGAYAWSMNSFFESNVPGASAGASATTPAICPSALIAIHTSPGSDILRATFKAAGNQPVNPYVVHRGPPCSAVAPGAA
jgi:hypothetical protein